MLPMPGSPGSSWALYRSRFKALFEGANLRVCIAFWLFGLINNVLYVIILSSALDLVGPSVPKGVVLLADVLPSFLTKLLAPYFIHTIPYPVRILIIVSLSIIGMLLVALTPKSIDPSTISTKMTGVILASLASGGGELSFLSLTHYYGHFSLAAWASGTGGAGLVGAGAYVVATTSLGLSVRTSLLAFSLLPVIMLLSFFVVLPRGPLKAVSRSHNAIGEDSMSNVREGLLSSASDPEDPSPMANEHGSLLGVSGQSIPKHSERSALHTAWRSFQANLKRSRGLFFPFMLPLLLVYIAEYTINQGVAPTLLFPLASTPFKHYRAFYPTYNAIYQTGVFISRSSTPFVRVHNLYLPSVLQVVNLLILTLHAIFNFIPSVYIIFGVIFWEGLLGGLVYVNTFAEITDTVPNEEREFSLGATSVSDSGGVCIAGFLIAVHGLSGSWEKTWESESVDEAGRRKLWLRDFLPNQIPGARVMSYGYSAQVGRTTSIEGVEGFASGLLQWLSNERDDLQFTRPVIFICHSLGGIAVEKAGYFDAMIIAHEQREFYRRLFDSIRGIVFMGTPHAGAEVANLVEHLAKFSNVGGLGRRIRSDLLKDLKVGSQKLADITEQWVHREPIYSWSPSGKLTGGQGRVTMMWSVVNRRSARLNLPNERDFPIDADHKAMVKFEGNDTFKYKPVAKVMINMVKPIRKEEAGVDLQISAPPAFVSERTHSSPLPSGKEAKLWRIEHLKASTMDLGKPDAGLYVNSATEQVALKDSPTAALDNHGGGLIPSTDSSTAPFSSTDRINLCSGFASASSRSCDSLSVSPAAQLRTQRSQPIINADHLGIQASLSTPHCDQPTVLQTTRSPKETTASISDAFGDLEVSKPEPSNISPEAQLLHAVKTQNLINVRRHLAKGTDPSTVHDSDVTPLLTAIDTANIQITELLLNKGAKIEVRAKDRSTCLNRAAKVGNPVLGRQLLQKKAKATSTDIEGLTPSHVAAHEGHEMFVQMMMDHMPCIEVAPVDCYGVVPLHDAAAGGHKKVLRVLLAHGADPSIQDADGVTPLHLAAENGHTEVMRILLEARASTTLKDNYGFLPLHRAAQTGIESVVQALLEYDDSEHISNPDAVDDAGVTALHLAAGEGFDTAVTTLLEAGADPCIRDQDGFLPVHRAAFIFKHHETSKKVVRQLILATPGLRYSTAPTPATPLLHRAIGFNDEFLLKLLLDHDNIDFNATDKRGITALHEAVSNSPKAIVEILLERSELNINAQDDRWHRTPLHYTALKATDDTAAHWLYDERLDINARDKRGQTALHLAISQGKYVLTRELIAAGIDVSIVDCQGRVALDLATTTQKSVIEKAIRDKGDWHTTKAEFGLNDLDNLEFECDHEALSTCDPCGMGFVDINSMGKTETAEEPLDGFISETCPSLETDAVNHSTSSAPTRLSHDDTLQEDKHRVLAVHPNIVRPVTSSTPVRPVPSVSFTRLIEAVKLHALKGIRLNPVFLSIISDLGIGDGPRVNTTEEIWRIVKEKVKTVETLRGKMPSTAKTQDTSSLPHTTSKQADAFPTNTYPRGGIADPFHASISKDTHSSSPSPKQSSPRIFLRKLSSGIRTRNRKDAKLADGPPCPSTSGSDPDNGAKEDSYEENDTNFNLEKLASSLSGVSASLIEKFQAIKKITSRRRTKRIPKER
ncbi:MAG: hypothetical protein M1812_001090 [Candelaria pacifica]|nr:MAG: hypothetical protein M1812_001090 [Candelaria pacifica]